MEPLLVELPLVDLRLELEEPELVSGRGRVDVPGRVVVPGRDVSGRVDVLGRDVPGRVVDEPGREELPGRVGALCGRVEVFGRNRTEPKSERR